MTGPGTGARTDVPLEAMHAHFTSHVYHRHSHETYSFGVTESGAQAFTCRHGRACQRGRAWSWPSTRTTRTTGTPRGRRRLHLPDGPHRAWPEFLRLPDRAAPRPLFRSPVIEDPAMAASALRRLHRALTGRASELERYERLAGTARLLVRHASGREPARRGADRAAWPRRSGGRADPGAHPGQRRRPGRRGADRGRPGRGGGVQPLRRLPGLPSGLRASAERLPARAAGADGAAAAGRRAWRPGWPRPRPASPTRRT